MPNVRHLQNISYIQWIILCNDLLGSFNFFLEAKYDKDVQRKKEITILFHCL